VNSRDKPRHCQYLLYSHVESHDTYTDTSTAQIDMERLIATKRRFNGLLRMRVNTSAELMVATCTGGRSGGGPRRVMKANVYDAHMDTAALS